MTASDYFDWGKEKFPICGLAESDIESHIEEMEMYRVYIKILLIPEWREISKQYLSLDSAEKRACSQR